MWTLFVDGLAEIGEPLRRYPRGAALLVVLLMSTMVAWWAPLAILIFLLAFQEQR